VPQPDAGGVDLARTTDEWFPIYSVSVIAAVAVVALFLLPKILHALGEMIALIVTASTMGVATAAPIGAWVAPVASVGVAATGAGTVIVVLVKAAKEAAKEPYEWTVPVLGILGGLLLDLAKGYGFENEFLKAALTAFIAFLVVVAGACWKTKDWQWRTVAVILLLLPPATLLIRTLEISGTKQLITSFNLVPRLVWFRLGGFVLIGIAVAILHTLVERRPMGRSYR
jgi:hypothetical protein